MTRLRSNSRIRPVRPYWSRSKLLTVVAVSTVALFWAATAWLHRSETRTVELAPSGPYRFASDAGPIAVSRGDPPILQYRASWLLRGPRDSDDGPAMILSCETALPCRAASELEIPAGSALHIEASDNDVSVDRFDGTLTVDVSGGGEVVLGPVEGQVQVSTTSGDVHGFGLAAKRVEIDTATGAVEVRFAERPARLSVRSGGEPVTIELPDGDYAVSVKGASSTVIAVGLDENAESEIVVDTPGPVWISATP